jgi:copper homeostasis protein CutC
VNSDNIAVLDTKVVTHNTVDAGASVIEIVIGEDDQNSVLTLLTLNENCVTTEELESLHGVVREGNDRVIIVNGIGNTAENCQLMPKTAIHISYSHQRVGLLLLLEDSCRGIELL